MNIIFASSPDAVAINNNRQIMAVNSENSLLKVKLLNVTCMLWTKSCPHPPTNQHIHTHTDPFSFTHIHTHTHTHTHKKKTKKERKKGEKNQSNPKRNLERGQRFNHSKLTWQREGSVALRTLERLFSCVLPHVSLETASPCVVMVAHLAVKALLLPSNRDTFGTLNTQGT